MLRKQEGDRMPDKSWIREQTVGKTRSYEAPTLTVIGPLSKITLGSGGTMADALNKLKH
jgi:hypothetical protein